MTSEKSSEQTNLFELSNQNLDSNTVMKTTLEQQLKKLNYYKVRYLCRNHVIDASPEDQNWHKDYIIDFILRSYSVKCVKNIVNLHSKKSKK